MLALTSGSSKNQAGCCAGACPEMATAVPSAPPTLVSQGTQTLQWKANRLALTARQALANQTHSIRCGRADTAANGMSSLQSNHGPTGRLGPIVRTSKAKQEKQQTNTSYALSQSEDPTLPDTGLHSQVPQ